MDALGMATGAAGAWCALSLGFQLRRARAFGPRLALAPPAGKASEGVRYAFLQGMAPGAKESVMMHLPVYALGLACHGGAFCALLLLGVRTLGTALPALPARILGLLALGGGLAGAGLLARRAASPAMRALSRPDDYLSSLLVAAFALLALPALAGPAADRAWRILGFALLAWIPLGKLRHCAFFFPTRRAFGVFFGLRGVLPPRGRV